MRTEIHKTVLKPNYHTVVVKTYPFQLNVINNMAIWIGNDYYKVDSFHLDISVDVFYVFIK